ISLRDLDSFPTRRSSDLKFWKDASQANASGVLHATDLTEGTVSAAAVDGKCSVKMDLYRYSSLFWGGLMGKRSAAAANSSSLTRSEEHTSELQSRENLVC